MVRTRGLNDRMDRLRCRDCEEEEKNNTRQPAGQDKKKEGENAVCKRAYERPKGQKQKRRVGTRGEEQAARTLRREKQQEPQTAR